MRGFAVVAFLLWLVFCCGIRGNHCFSIVFNVCLRFLCCAYTCMRFCCGCVFAVVVVLLWLGFRCGCGFAVGTATLSAKPLSNNSRVHSAWSVHERFHRQTQTHTKSTAPGNPPTNQATQATTSCTPCQRSLPHQPSLAKLTIHPGPLIALPAPPSTVLKTSKHATNTPTTSRCLSDPKKTSNTHENKRW